MNGIHPNPFVPVPDMRPAGPAGTGPAPRVRRRILQLVLALALLHWAVALPAQLPTSQTGTITEPAAPRNQPPATEPTPPATGNVPGRSGPADLSAFRIIVDRNIFNATRSGARPAPVRPVRRPARVDTLALVGVLENGSDRIAFFDGSDSEFRRAVRPGQQVAGLTVQEIHFDKVYLVREDQRWELPVGRALRREEEGPWQVADAVGLPLAASPGGGNTDRSGPTFSSGPASAGSSGSGGAADEVLRRLMERRAREEQ